MKIICVTGTPGSDVGKVADIFYAAGVKPAQPLRQDASFTVSSWHEKVIGSNGGGGARLGQVQQPGRFWEQFATNLFMENMQQAQWGWADSRSVWLLDFWQQFEPNLHFVLVYTSPQRALAEALAAEREHGSDTAALMAAWEAHQKEILRFHHRNPTRTILVDAAECVAAPAALIDVCTTRWKLDLTPTATALPAPSVAAPLVGYLAEQLRQTQPELQALQQELEASLQVLLPNVDDTAATPELFAAVEDYKQMRGAAGRADALALQINSMASQFAVTEAKLKAAHAEARSESDQILRQMHHLQEEMEQGFLKSKELEAIKANKRKTIDELTQKLVLSEATAATLKKELETARANKSAEKEKADALAALAAAKTELDAAREEIKRLKGEHGASKDALKKELEAAKANKSAEKDKTDALAALAAARKELDAARQDIKRLKGEHDAAKDALKKELEAAKANKSGEKEKADALVALTSAKKDLEAARLDVQRLKGEQVATKEAQQENDLLLVQLHQVQEELEHYFLEHKNAVKQNKELNLRWERMLARTPEYCDYASLELLSSDAAAARASWKFTNLNAAGRAYPELRFDTIITDGVAEFVFARDGKAPDNPEALDSLSASEWLLLPTLCRVLDEAVQAPTGSLTQLDGAQRVAWGEALVGLGSILDAAPATLRFDRVSLKREQVNPDYEHLWLQLGNLSLGEKRWGDIDFRLSCANVRPGKFGAHPKLEFPSDTGGALLETWFAESFDDFGDKLELRFALPEAMDMSVWEKLSPADHAILKTLVANLPLMLSRLDDGRVRLSRPFTDWQQLAGAVQSILTARTVVAAPMPTPAAALNVPAARQAVEVQEMDMVQKGFI